MSQNIEYYKITYKPKNTVTIYRYSLFRDDVALYYHGEYTWSGIRGKRDLMSLSRRYPDYEVEQITEDEFNSLVYMQELTC